MSELLEGQLQLRALARRKAALPQVLVLQPRNTRTHTHAHTHTTNSSRQGGFWRGEGLLRVRAGSQESRVRVKRRAQER